MPASQLHAIAHACGDLPAGESESAPTGWRCCAVVRSVGGGCLYVRFVASTVYNCCECPSLICSDDIYILMYIYIYYVGAAIFQLLQSTANVKAPGAGGGPVEAEP